MNPQTLNVSTSSLSESQRPRRILRSIVAVLAGLAAVFILSLGTDVVMHATGIYPPWLQPMAGSLFVLATAYRLIYGVLGGYITAWLAPDNPVKHAVALGVIGLILSIAGAVSTWNAGFGPRWYPLALVVTALPCSWLGGKLRALQLSSSTGGR